MSVYDDKRAYFVLLRSEHRNVNEMLHQISTAVEQMRDLRASDPQITQVVDHLNHLRQKLEQHFSIEECEGCLDEAVARCPGLGREVDAIKAEHPRLLEQLGSLIALANQLLEGRSEQLHFIHRWQQFAAEMSDHEAAEDRILRQGLESAPTAL